MSTNALTEEQIKSAAEWWAAKLVNPSFRTLSDRERGGPGSKPAALAEVMALMAHEAVEDGRVKAFRDALERLLAEVESAWLFVGVDYHPDSLLAAALESAGIQNSITVLPWKTGMRFEDGGVQVSEGYGAEYVSVLTKDEA